jgi:acyl-CoA thioesterase-1
MLIKAFLFLAIQAFSTSASRKIVFIGDSLTEGYGVAREQSYPSLIQNKLNQKATQQWEVVNSSISGSTTASLKTRVAWALKANPNYVVIALGANDGLRGFKIEEIESNLTAAILEIKKKNIKIILAGMKMPPNYGLKYTKEFENLFPKLAKEHDLLLIPFLLNDVAGNKNLNQSDGIHPNEKGHQVMAETVFRILEKNLL